MSNRHVFLAGGLGNRINNILNHLTNQPIYVWPIDGSFKVGWEDIFAYPKIKVLYDWSENLGTPNYAAVYHHENNAEHRHIAASFLRSLQPSENVARYMFDLPAGTDGYAIRHHHPESKLANPVDIPPEVFLATDSRAQKLHSKDNLQITGPGGTWDGCAEIRQGEGAFRAVAEWFMLMRCDKIYTLGLPYDNLADPIHSTFTDAHRIIGQTVVNLTI